MDFKWYLKLEDAPWYLKDLAQIEHRTSDLPIRWKYFHTNERAKMEIQLEMCLYFSVSQSKAAPDEYSLEDIVRIFEVILHPLGWLPFPIGILGLLWTNIAGSSALVNHTKILPGIWRSFGRHWNNKQGELLQSLNNFSVYFPQSSG